ncbi:MAG: 16S rRNA (cytidine(1402)-2'-O)-methyltransferase [Opitutae bacterium]|nr:16S rRNA (cytidine(1402)-2'-O)-methyltransferase [Opitutae bacterium]
MTQPQGVLYLVATPIGNLGDLSERSVESLRSSDLVACEDTRVTAKLLAHLGLARPTTSYREENELRKAPELAQRIEQGESIALVSDAGMPAISDPGFRLIRECRRRKLNVVPLPGPNAALTALAASGLPTDKFLFLGFPPSKTSGRKTTYGKWRDFPGSIVFYESKHRIAKSLVDLEDVLGKDRYICVAREMTKVHEAFHVGPAGEVRQAVSERSQKGEFVIVVAPQGYVL